MEAFIVLSIFSVAMFFGSYLAGCLPLMFSLSPSRLQLVTALGAGLLVGTALTVIIPEGMDTILEEVSSVHEKDLSASVPTASQGETPSSSDHDHPGSHELPQQCHVFIGVSMALGFVFMLLVDQLAGSHHAPNSSVEAAAGEVTKETKKSFTATVGLVIHSAADGIALGAAASAENTELEIVIFVAIMLHKAPAGFGLVSFLMHEGCDRKTIRCHLLAFSLAAPIAAFVSHYCFINIVYSFDLPITGLAMLFSAGTFLYVATVHVLTEIGHHRVAANQNGQSASTTHTDSSKLTLSELTAVICGILIPIVFNIFHAH
ncbi:zinc transporter ZIP9-like [Dysidea avara]|uniref:zinc transporter ZIP9-like n=1 Tax=Dysidea avara TaxID=196820 RepID=UPI00332DCCF7